MHHIEIRSISPEKAPLPITETGYKSIFITEPELAEYDSALEYVTGLLEEGSKTPIWLDVQAKANQYQLF